MLVKNGVKVVDREHIRKQQVSSPLLSTLRGLGGLIMLSDGTTNLLDLATDTPYAMGGGVAGAWTEESNFRSLLGVRAPVLAGATDNLLSDENASFEGGTVGGWVGQGADVTPSVSTAWAWHGSKSLKVTTTGATANRGAYVDVTAITAAGSQYTASVKIKNNHTADVGFEVYFYDNISGVQLGTAVTIAAGATATATATKTFGGGSASRAVGVRRQAALAMNYEIDAVQLEAGAVATPFCVDNRQATTCTIPTGIIGLLPGQALSIVCVVNTPWAGNDGLNHALLSVGTLLSANSIGLYKSSGNNLEFRTYDAAGNYIRKYGAAAAPWTASANHIVIATASGDTLALYLDGVELAAAAATGGREASMGATLYVGDRSAGDYKLSGSILTAIFNRTLSSAEISYLSYMTQWFPVFPANVL